MRSALPRGAALLCACAARRARGEERQRRHCCAAFPGGSRGFCEGSARGGGVWGSGGVASHRQSAPRPRLYQRSGEGAVFCAVGTDGSHRGGVGGLTRPRVEPGGIYLRERLQPHAEVRDGRGPYVGLRAGFTSGRDLISRWSAVGPVLLLRGAPPHPPSRCGCGLGGAWPAVRSAAGFTSRGAPSPPLMALGGEMCLSAVLAALLSQGEPPDPQTQLWRWGNTFM